MEGLKGEILGHIEDVVSNLLYYDRKEDESLPVGVIEQAIEDGVLTVDDIVEKFKQELIKHTVEK